MRSVSVSRAVSMMTGTGGPGGAATHLEPVDARQHQVEHHDVVLARRGALDPGQAVGDDLDVEALAAKSVGDRRSDGWFVLDDEDRPAHRADSTDPMSGSPAWHVEIPCRCRAIRPETGTCSSVQSPMTDSSVLSAPLVVEFPFTRSLGPVQSAFLTGLRERVVLGVRTADGRILVPPVEYDPVTAEEIRDLVQVAPTGTVTTWAWNPDPAPRPAPRPPPSPGSWSGSTAPTPPSCTPSTPPAPTPSSTGMRVRIRWAEERAGRHHRHRLLRAVRRRRRQPREPGPARRASSRTPVTGIVAPARLDYTYSPGRAQTAYIDALADRRTVGERCPSCRKVYVPPRGACPTCGVATAEQVEVGPRGTVTTFCIVNIKATNLDIEVPYVYAHIALDGADLALHGRIGGIPYDQVRMGLRVEPVWTEGGRYPDHYRPTGEPDADYDDVQGAVCDCDDVADRRLRADRPPAHQRRALRGRDAHAGPARGPRPDRPEDRRHRLHLLRLLATTSPAAPSPSPWRSTASAPGRRSPSRTSRWTAPGRCTRRGPSC